LHWLEKIPMNIRSITGITILGALLAAPLVEAQTQPSAPEFESSASIPDAKLAALNSVEEVPVPEVHAILPKLKSPVHFSKTGFLLLSAGVYTASLADMHQTLLAKQSPWWYEADPLARPLVRLPTPAYYATGLALATGVNWLSWKMGHSRRWRKLAPLPQLLAISGNIIGYRTNCH